VLVVNGDQCSSKQRKVEAGPLEGGLRVNRKAA